MDQADNDNTDQIHQQEEDDRIAHDETVEEAVYRYVRGLDFPESSSSSSDINWNNKRYIELPQDNITRKMPRHDYGHDDEEDDDLLHDDTDLLLRDASPMFSKSTSTLPVNISQRIKSFHEVLPKVSSLRNVPVFNITSTTRSKLGNVEGFETVIKDTRGCVERLSPTLKSNKIFTKEEDQIVDEFINKYCKYENITINQFKNRMWSDTRKRSHSLTIFWKTVYKMFSHRSQTSLYSHIRRRYHNFSKVGNWTEGEDRRLNEFCQQSGSVIKWSQIGLELDRMPEECKDHWRNRIKIEGKQLKNKWTPKEEENLVNIVKNTFELNQSINWDKVSEMMNGSRSRLQCRFKWKQVTKKNLKVQTVQKMLRLMKDHPCENTLKIDHDYWEQIAQTDNDWTAKQVQVVYKEWAKKVPDVKDKTMTQVITYILEYLIEDKNG
ncbi:similar to Saccharomyces cerevisiae YDR026C Protein of unknown function that may interact with ribosomes, based on co-purification experiments [Maudiozyma barnettii]|uniref:DNA-binding protein REB1 n=1 Tax=Maudiozyma barnettii TaxID=61262 RepID=A0A8H2ZI78_9SACH|nr:uncharacterized protein KABA2_06S00968 [Kazachstania barnettii]CAB4255242.1 similar to Saccharomyces cerevisiae YDR026C Protein of unknown function that may interact with ribosomes, based on co- purification experiments [Kazachstania barnettii]CAD1783649.1 similar to Saccharomyces cerevisiae YDR026C Protein of unknown function that may interact with ribosomes, based on co-purification experiments [Kazachstania barnettii]